MAPQPGLGEILSVAPVIPVVIIDKPEQAVPLARALVAGGLRVIEVTLRTAAGLDAIRAIAAEVPEAIVGVGTVLEPAQFFAAAEVGARFAVSPGATERLLDAVEGHAVPYLPGIATPAEAMTLIERGYRFAKFFPAEPAGGARVPVGAGLAAAAVAVLPDRRRLARERAAVSGVAQCDLCRRFVDGRQRRGSRGGLGRHYRSRGGGLRARAALIAALTSSPGHQGRRVRSGRTPSRPAGSPGTPRPRRRRW